jgi:hypothetical protein
MTYHSPAPALFWSQLGLRAGFAALLAVALMAAASSPAHASRFRRLDGDATAFLTDGARYAIWQHSPSSPLIVYDTLTRHRGEIADGCELYGNFAESPPAYQEASDGRFLVYCKEGPALLDARNGKLALIPEAEGFWGEVGSRYVVSTYGNGVRCRGMKRHEGCVVLYDIATRAIKKVPESRVPDIDHPGARPVCRALRESVLQQERGGREGSFSYSGGVLVEAVALMHEGPIKWLRIQRCHGRPILVYTHTEPKNVELRAGLLTWDSGHIENGLEEEREAEPGFDIRRAALTSYDLSTRTRRSWSLPALPLDLYGGEPSAANSVGVYGYSAHTKTMLFWIADRTLSCGKGGCSANTHYVYAARM